MLIQTIGLDTSHPKSLPKDEKGRRGKKEKKSKGEEEVGRKIKGWKKKKNSDNEEG